MANVKKCEFNLTYNANIINLMGIIFPRVDEQYPIISLNIDDSKGFAWFKLTYPTTITIYNLTLIVTLTFHVKNMGATSINLTKTA